MDSATFIAKCGARCATAWSCKDRLFIQTRLPQLQAVLGWLVLCQKWKLGLAVGAVVPRLLRKKTGASALRLIQPTLIFNATRALVAGTACGFEGAFSCGSLVHNREQWHTFDTRSADRLSPQVDRTERLLAYAGDYVTMYFSRGCHGQMILAATFRPLFQRIRPDTPGDGFADSTGSFRCR